MIYKYDDVDAHKVEMEITTYCNARCRRCPRTNPDTGEPVDWLVQEHMSLETFKMIFSSEYNVSNKVRYVKLCGQYGDPMMNPHINEMMEYVLADEDKDVSMIISTNGGLRNANWYATIAKKYSGRLSIIFGIDGLDHDTNWKYREGVVFDKAYANMRAFNDNDGETRWQFILFEWNIHQIEEAYLHAGELDIEMNFIVDLEYAMRLRERDEHHVIEELKQRFQNLGVRYEGI